MSSFVVGLVLASGLFLHFYNNDLLGVNAREIISLMLNQLVLPQQLDLVVLGLLCVKILLLVISLSMGRIMIPSYKSTITIGEGEYGVGKVQY